MVVEHDVLQPLAARAPRRRRRVAAVVGARQRDRRVREREQLEVVVAVDVAVELAEHVVERERPVDGVEAEGGHAAQGDGRHDSERAEPDPRGAQLVAAVDGQLRAVGEHELHRLDARRRGCRACAPVPCVPVTSAPASDCASMSPRFGSARPWACSSRTSRCRRMPASARTRPRVAVDVEHAVEAVEREQRPVGRHDAGERVAGARHAHRAAARDGLAQLGPARWSHVLGGRARLPARPVRPHACEATAA